MPMNLSLFHKQLDVVDLSPGEMVCQAEESWLFTNVMGGPLAMLPDVSHIERVLNIACGSGDWAIDTAFAFPHMEVAGIDFNPTSIAYANAKVLSQNLQNISFGTMNWLQPLDFSNDTFDLIYGGFLAGLVPRALWPAVLAEFFRILRPGGILCLTDSDTILSNSAATEQVNALFSQASQRAGFGFSPSGRTMGITPVLGSLLRKTGLCDVQHSAYMLDFSAKTAAWTSIYHSFVVMGTSMLSLVVSTALASKEDVADLQYQVLLDLLSDDFCGVWPFLCVWGTKP